MQSVWDEYIAEGATGRTPFNGVDPAPAPVPPAGACNKYYAPGVDSSWRLTYFSSARYEMLNFIVTPSKTALIVDMNDGKEKISDDEIETLFTVKK